ncbi:GNAT family N-acetyltransferase [Roseibium sp. RKSG952]|uniref:GNAT family N-acetyltransferase n=1 Tax=Roseibium sp. RKSG952 TaxID=2529384 RepID=UPI0012BCBE0B|nr:GNAT family N-acetyltransferase [Roseibium sp. RKSG952]MTH98132.1 GNAT family N-acetyltransferase [Roseibium sp. RKSG952]
MSEISIRPVKPGDLPRLLILNNNAVPAVNALEIEDLEKLIAASLTCVVALDGEKPVGFLLCLPEGRGYQSPNYQWLSDRYDAFAYTDRICVDPAMQGRRIGEKLYQALFGHPGLGIRPFVCEVNERPPNPGSLRFHQRLGFVEAGRADHGDKAVVFLYREPDSQRSMPS